MSVAHEPEEDAVRTSGRLSSFLRKAVGGTVGERICLTLLFVVSALLWAPRLRGPLDLRWDAGVYWLLGTSLASGEGYRLLNEPGAAQAVQYPPGLPLAIAFLQRMLGAAGIHDTFVVAHAMRILFVVLWMAYVGGAFWLARRRFSPTWSLVCALVLALQADQLVLSDRCFTEIPFGVLSLLFVSLHGRDDRPAMALPQWAVAAAAYLFRTAGIALFAAWVVEAALRKRFRLALGRGALAAAVVLGWQSYVGHVKASDEYQHPAYAYQRAPYLQYNVDYAANAMMVDPNRPAKGRITAAGFVLRFADNLRRIPVTLGEAVSVYRIGDASPSARATLLEQLQRRALQILLFALGGLTLVGLWLWWRRGERLVVLYVVMAVSLFCTTPFVVEFRRYAAPLAPFAIPALVSSLLELREAWAQRGLRLRKTAAALAPGVFTLILALQISRVVELFRFRGEATALEADGTLEGYPLFKYDSVWRAFEIGTRWLRERAAPSDVVVTPAAHWTYLNTGLKSVWPPRAGNSAELQALLDSVPAQYVILDKFNWTGPQGQMERLCGGHPELWQPVYEEPEGNVTIYRRR